MKSDASVQYAKVRRHARRDVENSNSSKDMEYISELPAAPLSTMLPSAEGHFFPTINTLVIDGPAIDSAGDRQQAGYIEWAKACLQKLDEVELIAIDPAIPCAISIALQLRYLAIAEQKIVNTISVLTEDGIAKSGLRIVLGPRNRRQYRNSQNKNE